MSLWEETRDVVVARLRSGAASSRTGTAPRATRSERRILELRGELAPGTRLSEGSEPFALYELPAPFPFEASPRWIHADHRVKVLEVLDDGAIVEETAVDGRHLARAADRADPAAAAARAESAGRDRRVGGCRHRRGARACPKIRRPTSCAVGRRATLAGGLPASTGDDVDAIVRAVVDLDRSYLAVQGPPGTGKTYVGSHVIARLVRERGYKVGVVAQSHAVVENMLDRIVAAGVPRELVAKAPKDPTRRGLSFTAIAKNGVAEFTAEHAASGFVVGGTAWDFSHEGRIPRGSLDLLVIDEAGQFSLASTIAVSLASPRLLLLGDPQQLPQVSQGTHPEPVDTSALGWVMDGADVIPPDYGYFLARTWRMHPAVAEPVSRLSYRGRARRASVDRAARPRGRRAGRAPRSPCATTATPPSPPKRPRSWSSIVRDLIGRDVVRHPHRRRRRDDARCRRGRSRSATSSS